VTREHRFADEMSGKADDHRRAVRAAIARTATRSA
jgi:hypothetical protein